MFKENYFLLSLFVLCLALQACSHAKDSAGTASVQSTSISLTPPAPAPAPAPAPTPGETKAASFQAVLADRYYLDSLFTDIFGPSARTVNTTNTAGDGVNHGSPCSIYENYSALNSVTGKYTAVDAAAACSTNTENLLAAQVNPNAAVTRQALLTRACSDLTTNNTTLNFAIGRVGAGVPESSTPNLLRAFHLFYRTQPDPSPSLLQSLQLIFPGGAPTQDNWRDVLFTVCTSSYWQIL